MRRPGLALAIIILWCGALVAGLPATIRAATGTYYLPVPSGTSVYLTQGNNSGDHIAANESQYAFDFALGGDPEFPVVAARAGTVLAERSDSTVNCPAQASCWSEWTQANYVLIDHGDKTSSLYVHLATGTVTVKVGDQVAQGQMIAKADSTGYSSANHLHFQVEQTPIPSTKAGWWWSQSVPIAFSDPSVLDRFPNGVPEASVTAPLVSGNSFSAGPNPSAPGSIPVLGGTWVGPSVGTTIRTTKLTLSAKPTAALANVNLTKVVFNVAWAGKNAAIGCTAAKAASDGSWSCTLDLVRLGAPLGPLTFGFDVFDDAGHVTHSPDGIRTATYAALPSAPTAIKDSTGPTYPSAGASVPDCKPPSGTVFCWTVDFSWSAAKGLDAGFHIYRRICEIDVMSTASPPPCTTPYARVATLPANARQYTAKVKAQVGYQYYVSAFNSAGESQRIEATWLLIVGF